MYISFVGLTTWALGLIAIGGLGTIAAWKLMTNICKDQSEE